MGNVDVAMRRRIVGHLWVNCDNESKEYVLSLNYLPQLLAGEASAVRNANLAIVAPTAANDISLLLLFRPTLSA